MRRTGARGAGRGMEGGSTRGERRHRGGRGDRGKTLNVLRSTFHVEREDGERTETGHPYASSPPVARSTWNVERSTLLTEGAATHGAPPPSLSSLPRRPRIAVGGSRAGG